MHCVPMHTHSGCINELMQRQGSFHFCRKCPNCYDYTRLCAIIAIIPSIIRIMPQPKVEFWVGIHCRLQANHIIHHGTTVFIAFGSGMDSTIDHEGAFSHRKAATGLVPDWVHTMDVGKPPCTHGQTKLIAQAINGSGYRRPLV